MNVRRNKPYKQKSLANHKISRASHTMLTTLWDRNISNVGSFQMIRNASNKIWSPIPLNWQTIYNFFLFVFVFCLFVCLFNLLHITQ